MRAFLDTNILLDVLMNRPRLVDESGAAIRRCEALGVKMWVAWHGLATAYYFLRRGRTEAEALREMDRILAWAKVARVGDHEARRARHLGFSDFEDALQSVAAEACGADLIITRNIADFANSRVPALTPAEFLARFPLPSEPGA